MASPSLIAPAGLASGTRSDGAAAAWIWGPRADVAVFGGSALLALCVAWAASRLGAGEMPAWSWFLLVVGVDVAHVWSTLFRTYLDRVELQRRRVLYLLVPLCCWAAGVALHLVSPLAFWRTLAYVAVFHFVRQQVGWVAIYRARAGDRSRAARWLDEAVVWAATGWPLLYWHTHLPRQFRWFVEGDFVDLSALRPLLWPALAVYVALLLAYAARACLRAARGAPDLGKHLIVITTAATWFAGIVAFDGDLEFTAANVLVHGVPYLVLLWAYARARASEVPRSLLASLVRGGLAVFVSACLLLAFVEEMMWDRLVWHDRPGLFGGGEADALGAVALALLVPLLAVPQATHYVLDAVLWRRQDTGAAQARALGFLRSTVTTPARGHQAGS
jgi:hypothetical protein